MKTDFELSFTLDELEMLAAAMTNYRKALYAVANRAGPAAREGREKRVQRAAVAVQLEERMTQEVITARGPLPGVKKRKK